MTDTPDFTLLGGQITEIARELRLLRLQVDNIATRLGAHEQRFATTDNRMAAIEQSMHDLIGEVARGFGQQQQQLTRIEQRFDVLDAGLGAIRESLAANTKLLTDMWGRES